MTLTDRAECSSSNSSAGIRFGEIGVGVLGEEGGDVGIGRSGEKRGDVVVEGISVLLEPSVGAIFDLAGIMRDGESLREARGRVFRVGVRRLGFADLSGVLLSELIEFGGKLMRFENQRLRGNEINETYSLVGSLRDDTGIVERGENTHRIVGFDEVDSRLQFGAKVFELPFDLFSAVLLLLQYEHVMVEELLEFLYARRISRRSNSKREKLTSFVRLMQSCSNPVPSRSPFSTVSY